MAVEGNVAGAAGDGNSTRVGLCGPFSMRGDYDVGGKGEWGSDEGGGRVGGHDGELRARFAPL